MSEVKGMITKVETVLIDDPNDEFDVIGEFKMPLQKDVILNTNIDRERTILREYCLKHGYVDWSID